ncbi:MAG TPA: hypothetical protein VNX86_04710 [Rhizomicrobium sp.]|jgi:hypothetical protein|nr:hypothetical protein [Rhizomicrobium sp.]
MRDLHSTIATKRSISPVAIGVTGTGQVGRIIDRAGYQGVEVLFTYGSIIATNAVFTQSVYEGDTTGAMTQVTAANLLGSDNAPGATSARASGTTKNTLRRVGYIGLKRYVQPRVKSTVTAGTLVAATVILGNPDNAPTPT